MGNFSEKYKLNQRLRNCDFGRSETVEHWKMWANQIIEKSASKIDKMVEDGTVVKVDKSADKLQP